MTGDSLIRTWDGVRKIEDLVGTVGKVYSINDKFEPYHSVVSKGVKEIYKLKLHNGLTIKATKDHKFLTDNGWKELGDLVIDQDMVKVNKIYNVFANNEFSETHEMYGWMHGDGWFNTTVGISFNYGDGDNDVKERLLPLFKKEFNAGDVKPLKDDDTSFQLQLSSSHAMNRCAELGFVACRASEKELPTMFYQWSIKEQLSFIRGLFSADGFITGTTNSQIALASTSYKLVEQIQHYLYSIGMQSRLMTTVFDEKINRKPQYKLILAGKSAKNYFRIIGFSGAKKNNKFNPGSVDMRKDSFVVREITKCGKEEVFDIVEVAETNAFYANGIAVHNCNLGSINLYNLVNDAFTPNAKVNYDKLRTLTVDGVTALNNILDYGYSMQPLDTNRKCIDDWRSIGLGVFGVADMFIALGLRYGSDEANGVMEDIMHAMLTTSLQASCNLAKEHGTFGEYDWEKTKKSPLIKMLRGTALYDDIAVHGLRNGTLLSIAPAGTISTMCGVSNGCEPLFAVSYERTTHSLEKQGKYFKVYAKSVADLLKYHGIDDADTATVKAKFPFVIESSDISPKDRVTAQAIIQQYVDNAISSTVNLCESATAQDIFDTYMLAWELGCKGITVFRTGCKRGSILGGKETVADSPKFNHITPVRRKDLGTTSGKTMEKHTACSKNMYVTVNSQDGNVVEVFTNTSQGCSSNINTITRMASLALRSGVKVDEVIKELRSNTCAACTVVKSKGNKGVSISCGAAIAEAIEEIYKGTEVVDEFVECDVNLAECPECHEKTLRPEGKCVTCSNCGYSKCD